MPEELIAGQLDPTGSYILTERDVDPVFGELYRSQGGYIAYSGLGGSIEKNYATGEITYAPISAEEEAAAAQMPVITFSEWDKMAAENNDIAMAQGNALAAERLAAAAPAVEPGTWPVEPGFESAFAASAAGLNEIKMPDGSTLYLSDEDMMQLVIIILLLIRGKG